MARILTTAGERAALAAGVFLELCYLALYGVHSGPGAVALFMAVHTAAYLVLGWLVWRYHREAHGGDRRLVWIIFGFGMLFRLSLVPHDPVASDDVYRYLWDGRVLAHGVNPYAYAPDDPHLSWLATPELPARVNHPALGTVYPPAAQAFFWVSNRIFGESVAGLKILLVLADACSMLLLLAILGELELSPLLSVLYAWSPLPVLYGGLDGHVDLLGIPLLLLALLWGLRRRPVLAAAGVAGAALVKLHPVFLAPFLWRVRKGIWGAAGIFLAMILFVAAYLPFSGRVQEILRWMSVFGSRWEFNGGVFALTYGLLGSNEAAHLALSLMLILWLLVLGVRRMDWRESVFQVFLGLVIFGPVVHPWYLLWVAALLVVRWSRALFVFLGLSAVSNIVVWRYLAGQGWHDDPLLLAVQYLPFAVLLLLDMRQSRRMPA